MNQQERCERIVNYIYLHQGCLTDEACKGVEDIMARSTYFKYLAILKNRKQIREEKVNKRDRRLYPYTDLLVSVPKELDEFKDAFFILIEKVKQDNKIKTEGLNKKYPESKDRMPDEDEGVDEFIDSIQTKEAVLDSIVVLLYQHLVGMCISAGFFIWSAKTNNKETLNKIHEVAFSRLQEILQKLGELFPPRNNYLLSNKVLENLFQLKPDKLDFVAKNFQNMGLGKQIEPVLDSMWKISKSSIPFGPYNFPISLGKGLIKNGKLVTWKEVLENRRGKNIT
jgi:hypothetical protein